MSVRYRAKIDLLSHLPGMHYIEVPKRIVEKLGGSLKQRLVCTVNGELSFQCGLVALGQGRAYITITKKRLKELGLGVGGSAEVELRPDKSRYGVEMPEELQALLEQDEQGKKRFEALTPGKQRYIIQYVRTAKNPDLRIDRAVMLIENLKKLPQGKEEFRKILGK